MGSEHTVVKGLDKLLYRIRIILGLYWNILDFLLSIEPTIVYIVVYRCGLHRGNRNLFNKLIHARHWNSPPPEFSRIEARGSLKKIHCDLENIDYLDSLLPLKMAR
jgi:hypothetical protein